VTWISAFPIAMAPLLLLPGFYLLHRHCHLTPLSQAILLPFVIQGCVPSRQDFKVAFNSVRGPLLWLALFLGAMHYLVSW